MSNTKILLDYVFPIAVIDPIPQASTAFLKQVCIVAKPKAGQEGNVGNIYPCTSLLQVLQRTDNTNATQLFNAGMSKVFVLLSSTLALTTAMNANLNAFFTLLVTDDFVDNDIAGVKAYYHSADDLLFRAKVVGTGGNAITVVMVDAESTAIAIVTVAAKAITVSMKASATTAQTIADAIAAHPDASALIDCIPDTGHGADTQAAFTVQSLASGTEAIAVGQFDGVVGVSSGSTDFLTAQAILKNRVAFKVNPSNGAKNLFYAFGKMLSNLVDWLNQQYIEMPVDDSINLLGDATTLFDSRISFVLHDDEFGNRLGLFAAGGIAIVAPYILKNLRIDLQSKALQWITANNPQYTLKEVALLETRLQLDVIDQYINVLHWITAGVVEITLVAQNFVANGAINVAQPTALWRVVSQMQETL